jgi:hypothetical protein
MVSNSNFTGSDAVDLVLGTALEGAGGGDSPFVEASQLGYRWLGHKLVQHVSVDPVRSETTLEGTEYQTATIRALTRVLCRLSDTPALRAAVNAQNRVACMSGWRLVASENGAGHQLVLGASMEVRPATAAWVSSSFTAAMGLQLERAEAEIEDLISAIGGELPSTTGSGEPNPVLGVHGRMLEEVGRQPPDLGGAFQIYGDAARETGMVVEVEQRRLRAEFPVWVDEGERTALLTSEPAKCAPVGHGVRITTRFPASTRWGKGPEVALRFAELEWTEGSGAQGTGGWFWDDGSLCWTGFIPAVQCQPSRVVNLLLSAGVRVRWLSELQL